MLILDYRRQMKDNKIVVSPFHTGHLGLLPDTVVQVLLIKTNNNGGCELAICPYESSKDLFNLKCILDDKPGVVGKLLSAIASLNINILTQESSSIDHMSRHMVCLLLDWTTSEIKEEKILNYHSSGLSNIVPINDVRFLRLYREIFLKCSDCLCWTNDYIAKPKIFLRYFTQRQNWRVRGSIISVIEKKLKSSDADDTISESTNTDNKIVKSTVDGDKKENSTYTNVIKIDEKLIKRICAFTKQDAENLEYIPFSEPESKTLRVIFPHVNSLNKLVHVGFRHRDEPGALATIMEMVAASKFNIVSGLSRKENFDSNIWEVLLEYGEETENNDEFSKENICRTVERKVNNYVTDEKNRKKMNYYQVEIMLPKYPKIETDVKKIPLYITGPDEKFVNPYEKSKEGKQPIDQYKDLRKQYEVLREEYHKLENSHEKTRCLDLVFNAVNDSEDKTVFLSYPESGKFHGECMYNDLDETGYRVLRSVNVSGKSIVNDVIEKITSSKFFVGIWHGEKNRTNEISPWMPFEYGVAKALGKKVLILCHIDIDDRIWNRIDGDLGKHRYSDLHFIKESIPTTLKVLAEFSHDIKQKSSDS